MDASVGARAFAHSRSRTAHNRHAERQITFPSYAGPSRRDLRLHDRRSCSRRTAPWVRRRCRSRPSTSVAVSAIGHAATPAGSFTRSHDFIAVQCLHGLKPPQNSSRPSNSTVRSRLTHHLRDRADTASHACGDPTHRRTGFVIGKRRLVSNERCTSELRAGRTACAAPPSADFERPERM